MMDKRISFINLLDAEEKLKMQVRVWRNYDFVRENMFNTHIISESEHAEFLKRLQNIGSDRQFIAFFDAEPFGVLNLHLDIEGKRLEFGYYLTDIKYVDGGYGAILEYALLNHAFFDLGLDTVFCRTLSKNKKVVSLHKRFGFDTSNPDEEVCFQSIGMDKWRERKGVIESVLNRIIPISEIGSLY